MIAFSFDIFCVPKESTIVTIELRASGIAATASAIANMNESISWPPRSILSPNTTAQTIRIAIESFLPNSSSVFWRGVFLSDAFWISEAILPTSVSIPTSVTSIFPLPYVTKEPE